MNVPVANVVISFDLDSMGKLFAQGASYSNLLKESSNNKDVFLFNNQANPNFISLEHIYNNSNVVVKLTLIDPNQEFEHRFISDNSVDLFGNYLTEDQAATSDLPQSRIEDPQKMKFNSRTELKKFSKDYANAYKKIFSQKSFFIAYGVGKNLSSWAGPHRLIFHSADLDYKQGTRKITLSFTPVPLTINAIRNRGLFGELLNLDPKGLRIEVDGHSKMMDFSEVLSLANFGMTLKTERIYPSKGYLNKIESGSDTSKKDLDTLLGNKYKSVIDSWNYEETYNLIRVVDFHMLITDVIRDYIRKATGNSNVVVLLPDINILCASVIHLASEKQRLEEEIEQVPETGTVYKGTAKTTPITQMSKEQLQLFQNAKLEEVETFASKQDIPYVSHTDLAGLGVEVATPFPPFTSEMEAAFAPHLGLAPTPGYSIDAAEQLLGAKAQLPDEPKPIGPPALTKEIQKDLYGETLYAARLIDSVKEICNKFCLSFDSVEKDFSYGNNSPEAVYQGPIDPGANLGPDANLAVFEGEAGRRFLAFQPLMDQADSSNFSERTKKFYSGRLFYAAKTSTSLRGIPDFHKEIMTIINSIFRYSKGGYKSQISTFYETNTKLLDYWSSDSLKNSSMFGGIDRTFSKESAAIIFGDTRLIRDYIYANKDLKGGEASSEDISSQVPLHPVDRLLLTGGSYNEEVKNILFTKSIGAFGDFSYIPDDFLFSDDDTKKTEELHQKLKNEQIPVFRFNTKNPNVLSMDVKLSQSYGAFLRMGYQKEINRMGSAIGSGAFPTKYVEFDFPGVADIIAFIRLRHYALGKGDHKDIIIQELVDKFQSTDLDSTSEPEEVAKDIYAKYELLLQRPDKPILKLDQFLPGNPITMLTEFSEEMYRFANTMKIKSLPMFHLSNTSNLGSPALLFARDRQIKQTKMPEQSLLNTFLSGQYTIMGFKHTISATGGAFSEFDLVKTAMKAKAKAEAKGTPADPQVFPGQEIPEQYAIKIAPFE